MLKNVIIKRRCKWIRWSDVFFKKMFYEDKLVMVGSVLFNLCIVNILLLMKLKVNLRFVEKNIFNIGVGGLVFINVYNVLLLYDLNFIGVG